MHGLKGGRWGQQASTSEIRRRTKVTTLRWATVSRRCIQSLNQRPTSHDAASGVHNDRPGSAQVDTASAQAGR